jgi:Cu+-exporting ATPase
MTKRFWIGTALTLPVFVLEMGGHLFDFHQPRRASRLSNWIQLHSGHAGGAGGPGGHSSCARWRR